MLICMKLSTLWEPTKTLSHSLLCFEQNDKANWESSGGKKKAVWTQIAHICSFKLVGLVSRTWNQMITLDFHHQLMEWVFDICKAMASSDCGHGENNEAEVAILSEKCRVGSFLTCWKTTDADRHALLKPHMPLPDNRGSFSRTALGSQRGKMGVWLCLILIWLLLHWCMEGINNAEVFLCCYSDVFCSFSTLCLAKPCRFFWELWSYFTCISFTSFILLSFTSPYLSFLLQSCWTDTATRIKCGGSGAVYAFSVSRCSSWAISKTAVNKIMQDQRPLFT